MADSDRGHGQQHAADAVKHGDPSPSTRALIAAMLLALVAGLLVLSSTALAASITGLAVAAPSFLLFSPVLVPVAMLAALTAMGMVVSGALALGGLALLTRLASAVRKAPASPPDYEEAKRRVAEVVGQKTAHVAAGQAMQRKGQEVAAFT